MLPFLPCIFLILTLFIITKNETATRELFLHVDDMPVAIVTRATAKQKKDEIRLANLSNLFAQKRAALLVIHLVETKNINIVIYMLLCL